MVYSPTQKNSPLILLSLLVMLQWACTAPKSNHGYCLVDDECTSGVCDPVLRRCQSETPPNYVNDAGLDRRLDMIVVDAALVDAQIADALPPDAGLPSDSTIVILDVGVVTVDAQVGPTDADMVSVHDGSVACTSDVCPASDDSVDSALDDADIIDATRTADTTP